MYYTYKITNRVNGKIYIGKSTCGNERVYLGSGLLIKRAIRKYGKDNFVKDILGIYEREDQALQAEKDAIQQFDSMNPVVGYNITPGGEGWTSETARQTALAFHYGLTAEEKQEYDQKRNSALRDLNCRKIISEKGKARFARMSSKEKDLFKEHCSSGWSADAKDLARKRMTGTTRKSVHEYWAQSLSEDDFLKKKEEYSSHMKAKVNSPEYKAKKKASYQLTMARKMSSPYWKDYTRLISVPSTLKRRFKAGLISKEELDVELPMAEQAAQEIKTKLEEWLHANDAGSV